MLELKHHEREVLSHLYLCPWYGPKGIGGSQDWLVEHDRLWGHHWNTPHLMTHLRRELFRGGKQNIEKEREYKLDTKKVLGKQHHARSPNGAKSAPHHSVHRHLGCCHRKSHWSWSLWAIADERSSSQEENDCRPYFV